MVFPSTNGSLFSSTTMTVQFSLANFKQVSHKKEQLPCLRVSLSRLPLPREVLASWNAPLLINPSSTLLLKFSKVSIFSLLYVPMFNDKECIKGDYNC
ncbi:hypothetical protein NC651_020760 [Populus alba x Populus x berolinensis]|nr:hypothetical protein NC651_020760 [Populus alba x Populus x berolinensis]